MLSCAEWYISHDSGTLSPRNTPEGMVAALMEEVHLWETGKRDPREISRYWKDQLLAVNSCKRILDFYEKSKHRD